MFMNYSYERVQVTELNPSISDPAVLARNPFLRDSLLHRRRRRADRSARSSPSLVYNTVDHPIFPTTGKRFTASLDLAGLGGNTNFYKPTVEGVWFCKQNNRHVARLPRAGRVHPRRSAARRTLPIFEKLFLGGEYSIRGFDLRTIGPRDPATGLVLGGNKSLLFNVE